MRLGKRRADLDLHVLGGESVVHDKLGKKVHVLNPAAHAIWMCCDGEHTLEEMVDGLAAEFESVDRETLRADILETLKSFLDKALLE